MDKGKHYRAGAWGEPGTFVLIWENQGATYQ